MSDLVHGGPAVVSRFPTPAPTRENLDCWTEPGVVHVAGPVDVTTRAAFTRALMLCEADPCVQALDLTDVDFFSSAGANCFVMQGWPSRPHVPIIASRIVRRVLSLCDMVYLLDRHGWRDA